MGDTRNPKAYIILALHAHLPYVRIPDKKNPLQEIWLYQAITECYIPLIVCLNELASENINFNITLSLSPVLISMLQDNYYRDRYRDYLRLLNNIISKILNDNNDMIKPAVSRLGQEIKAASDFFESSGGDITNEFKKLTEEGKINLITCPATHPVLPLYRFNDDFVNGQVAAGLRTFQKAFGFSPDGFWLPELGYYSGLDGILTENNIKYTFLEAHSVFLTGSRPSSGNFFPSVTDRGLAVFPREMELSNMIWSADSGYPGDQRYREFHFDYACSLPDPIAGEAGVEKIPLGLKIYRITGREAEKELYDSAAAARAAAEHSGDFFSKIINRAEEIGSAINRAPVFTLPFDAELFGHWWHEGPLFLKNIIKKISSSGDICLASPQELIDGGGLETVTPAESSWGCGGFFQVWMHPECTWVYPKIADLFGRLSCAAGGKRHRRAYLQAMKEIMLASSSDWIFFIANNNSADYGSMRLREHISAAENIIKSIEKNNIDEKFLTEREMLYPIFNNIEM